MKYAKIILGIFGILMVAGCSSLKQEKSGTTVQMPVGRWILVDWVKNIKDFKPGVVSCKWEFTPDEIITYKDGKIAQPISAYFAQTENGVVTVPGDERTFKYYIKDIKGKEYFFLPQINFDVLLMKRAPRYQVFEKEITMTEAQLRKTNFLKFSNILQAQKLSSGKGVKVAIMDWLFDMSPEYQKLYIDPVSLVPGSKLGSDEPWHGKWMVDFVHQTAPEAKIIPIKVVVDVKGDNSEKAHVEAYQKYIEEGIRYAADHGAIAVTTSVGIVKNTSELRDAVKYAESKGCIFIDVHPEYKDWSGKFAQNSTKEELSRLIIHAGAYPQFEFPFVGQKNSRDIFTWGYQIIPAFKNGYGPSNAPPIIGGVIALMKSANPSLTPEQIRNIIYDTGMFINGYKVLNAEAAVKKAIGLKE